MSITIAGDTQVFIGQVDDKFVFQDDKSGKTTVYQPNPAAQLTSDDWAKLMLQYMQREKK